MASQTSQIAARSANQVVLEISAPNDLTTDPPKRTRRRTAGWWVAAVLKALVGLIFLFSALFPLAWMVIAGFKARNEVVRTPFQFFPDVWLWENYVAIASDPVFLRTLGWTLLGAVLFTLGSLTVNSMAAYVFARLEFRFKRVMWLVVITTMFIPGMTILLTSFVVVTQLSMLDTLAVLVVPGLASAASVFFIRQFYLNIPSSLEEAAMIDGCGRWSIFIRLFLPLSKPPFVVMGITAFLAYWNSYVWPIMTITSRDKYVLQQYLAAFRSERQTELGLLMAGSALTAAPVVILFLIFQRQIIGNIKMSGLK